MLIFCFTIPAHIKKKGKDFMRKGFLRNKTVSLVLAAAMVVSCLEPLCVQAAVSDTLAGSKELELKFDNSIEDTSGKNIPVASYGSDNQAKDAKYVEGIDGQALALDGSTYLDLGTSTTLQPEEMTVSFWVKAPKSLSGEHIIMWNKPSGKWNGTGWYLSCLDDTTPLKLSVGAASEKLTEYAITGSRADFFPVDEWVHIAVTYSSKTGEAVFYRNGEKCDSSPTTSTAKIVASDTDHKYLGFNSPGHGGGYANLIFDQYEIYSSVATAEDVRELYKEYEIVLTDEEIVTADCGLLDPFAGKDTSAITGSVSLPTQGKNGSTISWESSNEDVVKTTGRVIRPTDKDTVVELTATIISGEVKQTKKFTITVLKTQPIEVPENLYTAYTDQQFALDEVTVTDDYYKSAQDADIAFLKKFDNDRILVGFRENAGLDTKGAARYNGWENGLLAGHCIGHYLSAAAQAVKATGDTELDAKLAAIVSELKVCQDNAGSYGGSKEGFLFGANVSDTSNVELQFDVVQGDASGNTWVPWYNMHKTVQGLVDVYKYTGNTEALEVASKLGDWVYNRVSKWTVDQQRDISYTEYGGMNDCMYELYKYTHKTEHRDAAHKFDDPNLYKIILSGHENTLEKRHANTTIPKFVGALNRYVALKEVENAEETDYLKYAEDFWSLVVEKHAYITGGTSDMEHFRADNALDESRTQCNCESCCAHNMLKLSKELFKVTGKKKYADYYESTLRNAIMGAVNKEGGFSYFTPMATGYYKTFGTADPSTNMFWCCTGTGMENYTKLGDSIYFKTEDAIIVNQYVASEVLWAEKNIKLTQSSDVTSSDKAEFTINLVNGAAPTEAAVKLRVPDWAAGQVTVKVNGEAAEAVAENEYLVLNRTWQDGDKIEMTYPMEVKAVGLADNDSVFAFQYGPTVLAAKLGTEEWNDAVWAGANLTAPAYKVVGSEKARLQVSYGASVKQILGTETISIQGNDTTKEFMTNINSKMEKTAGKLEFHIRGTDAEDVFGGEGLTFVPFNTLNEERYGIYWYFESAEDSSEEKILAEKEEGRFAKAIVDSIQPGYGQYENDAIHQMEESKTIFETGVSGLGSTRRAEAGGHFTYNMKVDKTTSNSLLCQFAKEDAGKTIKITVGDTVINYTVEDYAGEEISFKKYFEIPDKEIANAKTLTVGGETYDVVKVKFESGDAGAESARIVTGLYMTRAYGTNAELEEIKPSAGRIKVSNDVYTVRVPLATERVSLYFTLADASGLLYMDGKLVNDAKPQAFTLKEGTTTIPLKVYAQDHTTFKEYTLKLVREDGLEEGEEVLVNGDVENGTANWASHDGATLGLGYSTTYAGANSLKISDRNKTTSGAVQDITGKIKAGATYEIDAYAIYKAGAGHNDNPPENAVINISILYGTSEKREVMVSKKVTLNEWGNIYGDYTVPKDADVSKVSILVETEYKENPTSDDLIVFFVDNVSMKRIESQDNGDAEAAQAVTDKIAAIGTVAYTEDSRKLIDEARSAYDALTDAQKALVTNLDVLTGAETKYAELKKAAEDKAAKEAADKKAAKAVTDKIAAIGKVAYTTTSQKKIEAARKAYNALTADQKKLVTNYNVLTAAEKKYKELKEANTVKNGKVYKVSGYSYKVTNLKSKTVIVTGISNKNTKSITIKNTVKIKNITFKVTAIGASAFKNCKKATSATVGTNVKTVGDNAFYGCGKLKSVKLNSKVLTKIGKKAFYKCGALKTITIKSTKLKSVGTKAFYGINKSARIKVPAKKLKAYTKLMKNKGQKKTVKIVK